MLLPKQLSEGLFMDGMIYSAISNNLANDLGGIWDLHLSEFFYPHFHEHPPLAMYFQSLFFRLFGDHFWVEKLYSALMLVFHFFLLKSFWKTLVPKNAKDWWWPALLYILVPTISWAFSNNMLENTMGVFTGLAILIVLKNKDGLKLKHLLISSICIVLAFYSKGPVALFPLAAPLFIWLGYRSHSFIQMIKNSFILLFLSLGLFLLIYFGLDGAKDSWDFYFNNQVMGSLGRENGVRRTFVLERLFFEMILVIIISLVPILFKKKMRKELFVHQKSPLLFLTLTGASAILPIMVSPKQWSFYIVPSVFYFVLAVSIWSYPFLSTIIAKWKPKAFSIIRYVGLIGILVITIYSITVFGTIGRDKARVKDVKQIASIVLNGEAIGGHEGLSHNWSLLAYLARYQNIGVDFDTFEYSYFIAPIGAVEVPVGFEKVEGEWNEITLYKNKNYE